MKKSKKYWHQNVQYLSYIDQVFEPRAFNIIYYYYIPTCNIMEIRSYPTTIWWKTRFCLLSSPTPENKQIMWKNLNVLPGTERIFLPPLSRSVLRQHTSACVTHPRTRSLYKTVNNGVFRTLLLLSPLISVALAYHYK